jgi:hypothetical protein
MLSFLQGQFWKHKLDYLFLAANNLSWGGGTAAPPGALSGGMRAPFTFFSVLLYYTGHPLGSPE